MSNHLRRFSFSKLHLHSIVFGQDLAILGALRLFPSATHLGFEYFIFAHLDPASFTLLLERLLQKSCPCNFPVLSQILSWGLDLGSEYGILTHLGS